MKKLKKKSTRLRSDFKKHELNSKILKNIQINSNLPLPLRWKSYQKREKIGSKTIITNRCVETVSKKSFDKKFKLSRHEFRRSARVGMISGFKKAAW